MESVKTTFTAEVKKTLSESKSDKGCCKKAYTYGLEIFKSDNFTYIDRTRLVCKNCASRFFKGVFVACGSVNSPEKGHHLEIKVDSKPEADELLIFFAENGFDAKVSKRRSKYIVYFKDGDTIVGFLCFIGAQKCAFEFLDKIVEKQARNDSNRRTNCDTANMAKTAEATKRQMNAIRYLYDTGKISLLSDVLRITAELKFENPDLNLSELAAMHNPPITKSCANHRLAKIIEYYEKQKDRDN